MSTQILQQVYNLHKAWKAIVFCWVPGHVVLIDSEAGDADDEMVTLPIPLFLMMFYRWRKTSGQICRRAICVLRNILHRCSSPPTKMDICCVVTSCLCSLCGVHLTIFHVIVKCPQCGEAHLLLGTHSAKSLEMSIGSILTLNSLRGYLVN